MSWLLLTIATKLDHLKGHLFSLRMHNLKKYWIHSFICIMYGSYDLNILIYLSCLWGDWFSSNSEVVKSDAAVLTSDCDETLAFAEYHEKFQNACKHPHNFFDVTVG